MFNVGGGEVLVILLLALIVLGPQRLPEAARKLGQAIGEIRRMANGFQAEMRTAFDDAEHSNRPASRPATTSQRRALPPDRGAAPVSPEPEGDAAAELPPAPAPAPVEGPPNEPDERSDGPESPAAVPPDAVA
jgi:sec-independent protein translocase protein TatB